MKKQVEVVAAIICQNDHYLAVQRGPSERQYAHHKWEFPGGKTEAGETQEEAISREIREELNVQIKDIRHFITVKHRYPDFDITMHCFLCMIASGTLTLREHIDQRWLKPEELMTVDWAAADIPVAKALMQR